MLHFPGAASIGQEHCGECFWNPGMQIEGLAGLYKAKAKRCQGHCFDRCYVNMLRTHQDGGGKDPQLPESFKRGTSETPTEIWFQPPWCTGHVVQVTG